ncbi:hypothetical protein ACFLTD_05620, partial [Elusimicrobiota bacterium]
SSAGISDTEELQSADLPDVSDIDGSSDIIDNGIADVEDTEKSSLDDISLNIEEELGLDEEEEKSIAELDDDISIDDSSDMFESEISDEIKKIEESIMEEDGEISDEPQQKKEIKSIEDEILDEKIAQDSDVSGKESDVRAEEQIKDTVKKDKDVASDVKEKETVKEESDKKKSKIPIFAFIFIVIAGGSYYYFFMNKKDILPSPRVTTPPIRRTVRQPSEDINRIEKAPHEDIQSPYVYTAAQDVQKEMSEGIMTFVYGTNADISIVKKFYMQKLIYMDYELKSDYIDSLSEYAHMVFSKNGKDCSVVLKKKDGSLKVVVSYVQ